MTDQTPLDPDGEVADVVAWILDTETNPELDRYSMGIRRITRMLREAQIMILEDTDKNGRYGQNNRQISPNYVRARINELKEKSYNG